MFFAITALSALPGLMLIIVLRRAIEQAELARPH
jgi:PAT family beta-lactamase induction signal transducer AmpG